MLNSSRVRIILVEHYCMSAARMVELGLAKKKLWSSPVIELGYY